MMRLRFFSVLGASDHYRQQMLSIGCALGIAASFGAPFGGMLYAIETTSTYYPMDGYFPSFFACVVGAFTYRYVWNAASGQQYWISMLQTQYPRVGVGTFMALSIFIFVTEDLTIVLHSTDIRFWDMLLFAVLGLLLAGAGILLISLFARLAAWRNSLHAYYWQGPNQPSTTTTTTSTSSSTANTEFVSLEDRPERTQEPVYTSENFAPFSQADSGAAAAAAAVAASTTLPWYQRLFLSPYAYSLAIVLVTAVLNFPGLIGDFMGSSTHDALQAMFGTANMNDPVAMAAQSPMAKDWNTGGGVYFNLLLFGVIRLLLCSLSITLPLPAGMFMPCMAIGGAFGRCFGNIASVAFGASIAPGVFSVSGAAAMVAATTHSLSTILILLEVTGQLYFAYPVTGNFSLIFFYVATSLSR
jgi:H+/Cl- antiporter ClcA